jgi:hypothetical protein
MKSLVLPFAIITLFAVSAANAGDLPDLTGTWECELEGIVRGDNIHFKGKDSEHIQLIEGKANHVIEKQEGRRFWGYKSVKSGKKEHIIGMILWDNKTILTVDEDGSASGNILGPTEYEEFYSHTYGPGKMSVFCVRCRKTK